MKKESYEVEKLKKLEMEEEEEEEEEDKEQSSPVSVLDPPFQDDDEDIHMDDNNITSSFRSVQSTFFELLFCLKFSIFLNLIRSYILLYLHLLFPLKWAFELLICCTDFETEEQ